MNRLVLQATLVQRQAMRYTPAGLPALDLSLAHSSTVSEDGQPRQVSFEMRAVAIGGVTRSLQPLPLGSTGRFGGFLTSQRNGRGLLFHVTEVEVDPAPAAPSDPAPSPGSN
ncbi:MAG: primosomal replication protein N [Betaproteobacteria bacterium]|jgi:primosomal replication protein N|nr:primosomal replication protein N [Burkholderiaceae bacterium]MCZ8111253.1 primosomal replication protein N [Rubrivivax sp.]MCZ8173888.1 primosomal replication protein N [Burkholderiaceae bacterium]